MQLLKIKLIISSSKVIISILLILLVQHILAQSTTRISILFVGDIMQHGSQIRSVYRSDIKAYDYQNCFRKIAYLIEETDLAIGNLELTLAGPPFNGYPHFSAPDDLALELKKIGFDVLVTANNHSLDFGKAGLERTIRVLDSINFKHTGTFIDSIQRNSFYPLLLNTKGISLALLNYTYGTNGIKIPTGSVVNLIDTVQIKNDIKKAKKYNPDVILAYFHWGDEYQSQPNESQRMVAGLCFREGVQVIIGSHPHVLQPMHWNREKNQVIAYSLGNFVSGQRSRYRDGGALLRLEIEKMEANNFIQISIQNVSYDLVWVYKQLPVGYTILPVNEFEKDNAWSDASSLQAMKNFACDSRRLLNSNNANVFERKKLVIDSLRLHYRFVDKLLFKPSATSEELLVKIQSKVFKSLEYYPIPPEVIVDLKD